MLYNPSKGNKYHKQRNNKLMPDGTCGPTSAANAIDICGIFVPAPQGVQLEDHITELLMSKSAKAYMNTLYPGAKFNPWNASECVVWAVNKLTGVPVCAVKKLSMQEIIYHILINKGAIVMGTAFTKSRHFITVVGCDSDQAGLYDIESPEEVEIDKIKSILIDDSWGNYMIGYKVEDGDDCYIPIKTFLKFAMEGQDKKTCQVYYTDKIK